MLSHAGRALIYAAAITAFPAASITAAQPLSVGANHACATLPDRSLECWGWNGTGQLGDGSTSWSRRTAVAVISVEDVIGVASGSLHTCAVEQNGSALCWGGNSIGELGRDTGASDYRNAPGVVFGLENGVAKIATRNQHSCALLTAGNVKCWGDNIAGQLGNGEGGGDAFSEVPVDVATIGPGAGLLPLVDISTGAFHSCAIDGLGGVRCWGYNAQGQAGRDPDEAEFIFPTQATPASLVTFGINALAISAGGFHTCALLEGGEVRCWGWNGEGELGSGESGPGEFDFLPSTVLGLDGGTRAIQIASGQLHTCALLETNEVLCWGENSWGQLGNGTTQSSAVPVSVNGLPDGQIESISAGYDITCAQYLDANTYCWGDNRIGALGMDPRELQRPWPEIIRGLPQEDRIVAIDSGYEHACAMSESGSVFCWGRNREGELGDASLIDHATPVELMGLGHPQSLLAAGGFHTCANSVAEGVRCWGVNSYGGLGDGTTIPSPTPTAPLALGELMSLQGGGVIDQTCALQDNTLQCWGARFGLLASGAPVSNLQPFVAYSGHAITFSLGEEHGCVIDETHRILCWGNNFSEQFGNEAANSISATPVLSGDGAPAVNIAAGRWHTCVVDEDGSVKCWGGNIQEQLGDGQDEGGSLDSAVPVIVAGFEGSADATSSNGLIASKALHTCALNRENTVKCWGLADAGQLGDQSQVDGILSYTIPRALPVNLDIGLITDLTVGFGFSCALSQGGTVACWGDTTYGQLGTGTTGYSSVPRLVLHSKIFLDGFEDITASP